MHMTLYLILTVIAGEHTDASERIILDFDCKRCVCQNPLLHEIKNIV